MIEVQDLTKTFRIHKKEAGLKGSIRALFHREWHSVEALKSVTFNVKAGETVGLVGANGAGKTTLLKLLSGILHPTSGSAKVLGHTPWERSNQFRRQIALIMGQKAQLWWDLPAADCFLLLKEIYEIPQNQYQESLDSLTQLLDVRNQMNTQIRRLSLGERMKMELIAALLHRPRVVFLDEPTIGLDVNAQRALRDFIANYSLQWKPALILTSHYMEDIKHLCRRVVIIREGDFIYDGPLSKVVHQFTRHKVVTVALDAPLNGSYALPKHLGEVLSCDATLARFKVDRERIAEASSWLLQNCQVSDLSIEEEDISTVISKLFLGSPS